MRRYPALPRLRTSKLTAGSLVVRTLASGQGNYLPMAPPNLPCDFLPEPDFRSCDSIAEWMPRMTIRVQMNDFEHTGGAA